MFPFCNLVSVRTIISGVLVAIMCFRSCWLVRTLLTLRVNIFNEERYLVSVWLEVCVVGEVWLWWLMMLWYCSGLLFLRMEDKGEAFMLRVYVFCLMGVISRLG